VTIKNSIIRFSFLQVGEEIHREQWWSPFQCLSKLKQAWKCS
jgi:hypothetical protein